MAVVAQPSDSKPANKPGSRRPAASVTANDRFSFTLFLAAVLHAILILGVGFTLPPPKSSAESLEITIAHNKSEIVPDDADFLAQINQQGSGTLEEKAIVSTTKIADFEDNVVRKVNPVEQQASKKSVEQTGKKYLSTSTASIFKTAKNPQEQELEKTSQISTIAMYQRSMEIASLEAQLNEKKQVHSKRPRKRQLTANSTKAAQDAAYLDAWRRRVERFGNMYYPPELKQQNAFGSLRLMVAVKADGSVHEIRILKSSGKRVIDDAAMHIVKRSAPFPSFPKEIAATTDILEIIRTWQFKKGNYLSSF